MLAATKKFLVFAMCITSLASLNACVATRAAPPSASSQLNQICRNLKQEIILNAVGAAPNQISNNSNPAREAQLYKLYEQYHCDEILRQNKT